MATVNVAVVTMKLMATVAVTTVVMMMAVVVVGVVVVSFRGVGGSTRENDSGIYRTIDDVKCTLIVLIMYIHGM